MIKLLVFLGNPGKEYENTRHNAGFIFQEEIFPSLSFRVKFHSAYAYIDNMHILKPMTYMNNSGTAVSECTTFFKIKSEEVMVIHDDLELECGKIKFQLGGGLKGHNGLKSIKERLGSDKFWHLRIGIGRPIHNDVRVYVTSPFTKAEEIKIKALSSKVSPLDLKEPKEKEISI